MAISVQQIFNSKARRVNADVTSAAFQASFVEAFNSALMELNTETGSSFSFISSHAGTIDADNRYMPIFGAGIDWHLHKASEWNIDNPRDLLVDWQNHKTTGRGLYLQINAPNPRRGATS